MRIGSGFDAHRYGEEKAGHRIMLGGVAVPWQRVVVAHSDGDVILHALCDAILGALALGDIGRHFPDTDPAYANADSRQLLRACVAKVAARGMLLVNADITLIAERPKVAAYVDAMCATIAQDLGVAVDQVSVKATTTEKMGFVGREEGLAAQAVVLLANCVGEQAGSRL
ncbi:MAG: 2-C-methyl-D-erythritol 2,4-cyclodiphosphate synthase [Pseudomonadales bacterium]|jgi:2-C-methyl-D-erythritol 2,4-cyclodiphosphate synthase|nr:2-C-methyl-D-erythritol 2,4-cyclodiphosphate synthase [Pseudomonadales bacterium]MDP4640601.1 2-C-methyl-D-erythritol 2,4-cyclodiphosphate synthase [Pseudomonadales bacterium]MDP4765177.1 2-C-methyl-D-erythritol 2,4-cyclodiphosphate synthase [Pseudomonadales bacterium]MDP4875502.1 2-C-methyl-D-erythritol 2,4-cyclodiphosphate synthase [Pseudomonadales bacterium]MDP4912701.1 2-C-methyl-D-erythritol 2,4-cyclodiphosphate synthase [Pseudomonadales bacterium]